MPSIRARWLALPPAARHATRFALLGLPVAAAMLRLRGLAACRRSLEMLPAAAPVASSDTTAAGELPADLHRGVELASRILWGSPRCLPKALVLERLSTAHGLSSRLRFALDPSAVDVDAHAWIDIDGRAYGALARYSALFEDPGPKRAPREKLDRDARDALPR